MSSFQFQADMYNSLTPMEIENNKLKEQVVELQEELKQLREEKELEKRIKDLEVIINAIVDYRFPDGNPMCSGGKFTLREKFVERGLVI